MHEGPDQEDRDVRGPDDEAAEPPYWFGDPAVTAPAYVNVDGAGRAVEPFEAQPHEAQQFEATSLEVGPDEDEPPMAGRHLSDIDVATGSEGGGPVVESSEGVAQSGDRSDSDDVVAPIAMDHEAAPRTHGATLTTPASQRQRRWTLLLTVLTVLTSANLFLTWTASNGRGAGVQAVRSLVSQPIVVSSTQPAGRRNTVTLVAEGGRRPVLSTVLATSGFPRSNSEVRVRISGIENSAKGVSVLDYVMVQTTEGGRLDLDFPDGMAGKINGTITVTIAAAPQGGVTALVAQGYQV